jgi:hypothetical protein
VCQLVRWCLRIEEHLEIGLCFTDYQYRAHGRLSVVCCKSPFKLPARCNFFTYVYESELWADDGDCSYGRFISASPYSLAPRIGPDSDEYMVHQLFPCASLWTCDFCLPAPSAVEYEDTDPPHSETRSIGVNARVRQSAQGSGAKPGPLESLKMASGRVVRQPRYVQRMTSNAPWLRAHGHVWDGFCAAPIRFKLQRFPNGLIPESHHTGTIYVKSVFFLTRSSTSPPRRFVPARARMSIPFFLV